MKEIIMQKLGSRKLWAAIAAALLCVLTAFFGESIPPEMAEYVRMGAGSLIAYVFGEAAVDVAREIGKRAGETEQKGDDGE